MKKTVTKSFTFDYAHRLMGKDGNLYSTKKCGSIHGHTGKLEITVSRNYDPDIVRHNENLKNYEDDNNFNFVTDFSNFKPIKKSIMDKFDHATIVYEKDNSFMAFLKIEGMRYYVLNKPATSENMLDEIVDIINRENLISSYLKLERIRLYETPTSYSEVIF